MFSQSFAINTCIDVLRQYFYQQAQCFESACFLDSGNNTESIYRIGLGATQTLISDHQNNLFLNGKKIAPESNLLLDLNKLNTLFSNQPMPWLGALSYEAAWGLEKKLGKNPFTCKNQHRFIFFQPQHLIDFNGQTQEITLKSDNENWIKDTKALLSHNFPILGVPPFQETLSSKIIPHTEQLLFTKQVDKILHHIHQGDIYQANLSIPFSLPSLSLQNYLQLYQELITLNPAPFSGLFLTPNTKIICNSPERLIRYAAKNNQLQTLPIAGTRSRGQTPKQDLALEAELLANPKENAEHLMLLDLMRNDLARVAEPASVNVPKQFYVEHYSHVMHLVSEVTAKKAEGDGPWDILKAVFPGGTITGCPKIRCMQILAEVEQHPRGFYTGSLGYVDPDGSMDFNILIRSLFDVDGQRLRFQAGAGIVADSVASWEYKECHKKTQAIQAIFKSQKAHDNDTKSPSLA